ETWTIFGDPALNLTPRPRIIITNPWAEWNFNLNLPESLEPRLIELANNSQDPRFVEMDWSEDWIHVEPAVLMIEPGKTAQVKVYADLTRSQLAPGAYTASIVARDLNEDTADQGKLVRLEVTDADCEGDLDGDGRVSITDLLQILSQWGACGDCTADLNGDGTVDVTDLLTVLAAWGSC
ncbi:MAG: dockerin type I domain-containing protein, partial [Phycisphaerales bacterium]|nr:dockerin type I domain-containing protein [Phycisphaerales bacterium]